MRVNEPDSLFRCELSSFHERETHSVFLTWSRSAKDSLKATYSEREMGELRMFIHDPDAGLK